MQTPRLLVGVIALNLIFSTVGDAMAKIWGITNHLLWLWVGLGINVFTIFFFMVAVKLGGLAVNTTIILILTIVLNVFVGFLIFHEKIAPVQWFGIALGLIAIVFVADLFKFA